MAENNRNLSIFLLVLALVGAALFYGCGSATSDSIPPIEYYITGSYTSEGLAPLPAASARAVSGLAAGILIYSELDPSNLAEIDINKRTYLLKNLKPGKHYLVFKHIPNGENGTTYIYRTQNPVILTESAPVKELNEVLRAEEGVISITGKLTNTNGQPITPAPIITLWGQNIEVNALTGEFTTPKMPVGTTADLIVNAINYQQTSVPVVFENNPAYYEFQAVDTTINNAPPTITLSSKQAKYNKKSTVTLTATAEDPNGDELEIDWFETPIECTSDNKGLLEVSQEYSKGKTYISEYYWTAPDDDCLATFTVTVREKNTLQRLSAKAKLKIQIGTGEFRRNTIPQILSTDIYPTAMYGNRTYTITCIATDTDGDALFNSLVITPNAGTLNKSSGNVWSWKTPDLATPSSYLLSFTVKDPKGNTATSSMPVTVGKTQPNQPPRIVSLNPSSQTNVTSGKSIVLTVNASDPENEKLTFIWNSTKGQLASTSQNLTSASATWIAPYINNATTTIINCIVQDPYHATAIGTFTLNIQPNPNKKAPIITLLATGSTVTYNETIPLFKPGETVLFEGSAIDANQNVPIEASHYRWEVRYAASPTYEVVGTASSTASYKITSSTVRGDYIVRMTSTDLGQEITGEETTGFRVNTIPTAEILCNGKTIGTSGRTEPPTTYFYEANGVKYDVFQIDERPNFTAVCEDVETSVASLSSYARWTHGSLTTYGATYSAPAGATGTNKIDLTTTDSKGETSATATYQYYVNSAPVVELATSTKTGFINTDVITLNTRVTDDYPGLKMTWYYSCKSSSETEFSPYQVYSEGVTNPITTNSNTLTASIEVPAANLMAKGNDFKFRVIATDSMGVQIVNDGIGFSIVNSHTINDFVVASGVYSINERPYTFDELLPALDSPYEFEAKQKFSIRSGSDLWQDAMTWTWYDSQWNGDKPGSFNKIADDFVDGYTLNGYHLDEAFGTHTIRLEGKSNEYGIVASKSIEIFINSTPKIEFNNMVNGTIRFDTNSNATFTITIKEDNKYEKLGLVWSVWELDKTCKKDKLLGGKPLFSHDLDSSTGKISPVDMAGSSEKNVTVNWIQIVQGEEGGNIELASGAKRVEVCAFDAYGKAATASVDILVNTLPVFNVFSDIEGEPKVKITVPTTSDNGEDYQYFTKPYTTTNDNIPVYLVAGNPSMQLHFVASATDYETGDLTGDSIIWKYTDYTGAPTTKTGVEIDARFGIGLNTVNVECRDGFYNYYTNEEGQPVYNHMCIATCSADFYVWQSMAFDLIPHDSGYKAHALFNTYSDCIFYVVFGNGSSTYVERYQLDLGVNTTRVRLIPGELNSYVKLLKIEEDPVTHDKTASELGAYGPVGKIITLLQAGENSFYGLSNNSRITDLASLDPVGHRFDEANAAMYFDAATKEEMDIGYIASYTLVEYSDFKDPTANKPYYSFASSLYPNDDKEYPKKILSMTYSDANDPTAGAMLLKGWTPEGSAVSRDVIAAYSNLRLSVPEVTNSNPLYYLDGYNLDFTENSKVRYIHKLNKLSYRLFFTDTMNNRLVRLKSDFSEASTINASQPIDICSTNSKYLFSLAESGNGDDARAITLYSVDNASYTRLTTFGEFISDSDPKRTEFNYRAGKVKNPKSIIYHTKKDNNNVFGGLIILEDGDSAPNRVQLIRANKEDWLE